MVRQRWLSTALFRNAARPGVIRSVLKQAYPSGANIDDMLVNLLYQPTQRDGAAEAFRGFINLFDDYLAPQLMQELNIPVDLIWGRRIPDATRGPTLEQHHQMRALTDGGSWRRALSPRRETKRSEPTSY